MLNYFMSDLNTHLQPIVNSQLVTSDHLLNAHADAVLPQLPEGDLWVFGYGSLMWRPGFDYIESVDGRLYGYHRALCVSSWVHRGTPEKPGLVLGLDRGGSCSGKLFRISCVIKEKVAQYLYDRELATMIYFARIINVHTKDGRRIQALTFVVDTKHQQYVTQKCPEQLAKTVAFARGLNGKSSDYLLSTLEHLRQDGIHDSRLEAVAALI
ncbi:MAG: hypothetical protein OFPI_25690 [Osedax symbiont Rs2]|nr:MAG: hypothetical protein OFPI_25690 [Osedax symbiont Rs2]